MTDAAACRAALEAALDDAGAAAAADRALAGVPEEVAHAVLRDFAVAHGVAALPLLTRLAAGQRHVRRAARRAIYRLAQRGVTAPPPPAAPPVVARRPPRAVRAWVSGIDGTGSRAVWVLFETSFGATELCSLIVNDVVGIRDVAGGQITRKRLEDELAALRAAQKLPWVEVPPARALRAVSEALERHAAQGTEPPAAFGRWWPVLAAPGAALETEPPAPLVDPELARRGAELLELPELASWFVDPEAVQSDALQLGEARESRLVVSDAVKAEREAAIVDGVIERELTMPARRQWASRLAEMAWLFAATDRAEVAAIARAAAATLADATRPARDQPFAAGLARRGLELATEVAAGRLNAADVSRKP